MPSRRRTPPARTAGHPRVHTQPFRRRESPGGTRSGRPQRAPISSPNPAVPSFHLRRRRSILITPGCIGGFDLLHAAALFGGDIFNPVQQHVICKAIMHCHLDCF